MGSGNSYDTKEKEVCDIVEIKDTVVDIKPTTALNFTGTTSYLNTTFNGLNALSGAGVLSIPYALSSGGWLSLILLFIIASATFYTGLLIKRCIEIDPNIRSYADVGNKAFGKRGALVSVFLSLELYMVATGSARELEWTTYCSQLICLLLLCSSSFPYTLQFNEKSNTILVGVASMLCFQYSNLCINGNFGVPDVWVGSTIQITLNLPTHKFSSKVAIYTALINPIAKYALTLRPIVDAIEDCFQLRRCYSLILRTTLVCSSVIVALTIPFFGYLMSLVGAFLSVTTSILLPCFCYLKISGAYRKIGLELAISSSIVLMGLIILVIEHIRLYIIIVSKKSMDDVG
ncbi:Amino acid transporter AVT1J [Sesamum angolense]|uniref:Amino acid transporter AVT1J n=1 Tax=Sesamum angolense TaxID=2727404 RepID=A0AAE1WGW4_9LAMI|nr:Amino acid transporter AVT1J [Sesamum angolense]